MHISIAPEHDAFNIPFNYIVISPVRDEADHIAKTIASMAAQTILPQQWIIVDDGSTDGTSQILDHKTAGFAWITVVHRVDRGFRAAGSGVVEAFKDGLSYLTVSAWDYIVKLDGDLSFEPDYFERCLSEFLIDPCLGIVGGTVYTTGKHGLRVDSPGDPRFHVRGATKIYSRACWHDIEPLVPGPGWDTIDEVKANLYEWTTRTLPEARVVQHKPTGAAAGKWRDGVKNGQANYLTGYHPLFLLAKCVKRTFRKPYLLGAVALMYGYFFAYLERKPKLADETVVRYVRRHQISRLLLRPSIYD
ncbi:glycosyltransferase [uncultured Azohydromonas sp.]|jgi:Glycosyltransferases involved in cell wall biogenesis|uniref:glycosyltransferase family 2 protein n=1 Tax=uncultured Azohydromonas sp. TaxID=487342 RepID=UPI002603B553|nr:glycosyltransferase [uncultured Azohydromonas sp.]